MNKKPLEKSDTHSAQNAPSKKKSTRKPRKLPEKEFIVVGLGASAGGVKALQEFFELMPPDSGMAFVVILHLSPAHESNLAPILQARTKMPVIQVTETHKVKPDHIYVIPPNQQLEMVDGVVRCTSLNKPFGTRVAIDVFFRTLADAYERRGVCIVMSGTGADGTLGLKRIKESNGFTIVQSPEDAEYDSMPINAIATGLVDWVLPVREMPRKLASFSASTERFHLNAPDSRSLSLQLNAQINAAESLSEILTILRVRTGHDFFNYKTPTLVRRIARQLQIHELEDISTYLNFLRDNPLEVQTLQRNLLINVTNFFRDSEAFAALEEKVIPQLFLNKTGRDTVRVWSAGCASGEEAFSIAMLLTEFAEKLPDPPKFQIFATDVDDEAIQQAREHRYSSNIAEDVKPDRLKKFFVKEGKGFRIRKELRDTILFVPHNVLRDPPFSRLDLVSCRNLLIYLKRETQDNLLEVFHFALAPHGYLFLGSSESAENLPMMYSALDKRQNIYTRRSTAVPSFVPHLPLTGKLQISPPHLKSAGERAKLFTFDETYYRLLESIAPPFALVNEDFNIVFMSESVGRFMRFAGGVPSPSILKLIHPDLLPDLRAALFNAQRENLPSEFLNIRVTTDAALMRVNLSVRIIESENDGRKLLLAVFNDGGGEAHHSGAQISEESADAGNNNALESVVHRLEDDLTRTRTQLRATLQQHEISIEELKASNEELQAINEELRSATEELETSREEAQSINEELTTVNTELKDKIDEWATTNSDLQNLIASTDIATIFLDRQMRIKRFTPRVEELFNLTTADEGRPLGHFTSRLDYKNLAADAARVLKTLEIVEREITDDQNNCFLTRFVPYRTREDRIDGVVMNFIDITERRRAETLLRENESQLHALITASSDVVYSMNADWSEMCFLEGKNFIPDTLDPNRGWLDKYIPEEDKAQMLGVINQAIFTKSMFEMEHRVLRLDDSIGWTFSRAVPLLDEIGEIKIWVGTAHDITEHRQFAEQQNIVESAQTVRDQQAVREQIERSEAEKSLREKETLRRLIAGQEEERRRIARDIHDHFGQQIIALRMKLDAAQQDCADEKIGGEIEAARKIVARLDADVDFIAWELRPAALDDLGLRIALHNFVREWSYHTKIRADFHTSGLSRTRLDFETETNIYRIAQEALNNIYKHSAAKNVSVLLEKRRDNIVLIIEDDGRGFDPVGINTSGKSIGLNGMRERAHILGGELEIESKAAAGTTIFVRVPHNVQK